MATCSPCLDLSGVPPGKPPLSLHRTGKDVMPFRQGVVITRYMSDYIPPALMPDYQGNWQNGITTKLQQNLSAFTNITTLLYEPLQTRRAYFLSLTPCKGHIPTVSNVYGTTFGGATKKYFKSIRQDVLTKHRVYEFNRHLTFIFF